ncbi:MAG TPA: HigA family addiction module antidote protein [Erysipelotrichaceae bacterium]|nr:HigA family addiction module antidote protein [Erysipelotrichaceae bacterium]
MRNKEGRVVNHPGVYLKDAMEELGLNQSEFALRTGLSTKNVSTLVNGESDITFDVAVRLAAFFNNEVEGWINLQTKYNLYKYREKREKELEEEWRIVQMFNKEFLSKCCNVTINNENKEKTISEMRNVFRVGTLQALKKDDMYAFCKTSVKKDIDEKTIILRNAWISIAETVARDIKCSTFDKDKIISEVPFLRSLTLKRPEEFQPLLKSFLASAGVKLVILPYLSNSNVSGVTKWMRDDNSVMVAINDCGKVADRIWFSIFHELGHAIRNHKRHLTISYEKNKIEDEDEKAANKFAQDSLIDPIAYSDFVAKRHFDLSSIDRFAEQQGVADFIVIGRLKKDKILGWTQYQNRIVKYSVVN